MGFSVVKAGRSKGKTRQWELDCFERKFCGLQLFAAGFFGKTGGFNSLF